MKFALTKKTKSVTMETVHEKSISIYKSWLITVGIFLIIVLVSVTASAIVFYSLLSVDVFQNNSANLENNAQYPSIDGTKLKNAIEFINSRAASTGIMSTSTNISPSTTTNPH